MEKILIDLSLRKSLHTAQGRETLELSMQIPENGFITVFGKSGVGKTTLLKMIAGLEKPDTGYIRVMGETWFDSRQKINVSPQKRNIGFVFQDYALFPNMTVKEHLLFAQNFKEKEYVSKLLDVFHLKGLCERKPAKLSGGQQQRLAVARALARKPRILLMDEPLSALDSETREMLQTEILQAHQDFDATTLLVTHDISEVFRMSDFVYMIEKGKIIRQGTPVDVFGNARLYGGVQFEARILNMDGNQITLQSGSHISKAEVKNVSVENFKTNDLVLVSVNENGVFVRSVTYNIPVHHESCELKK